MRKIIPLFSFLLLMLLIQCRKENASWDTGILTPLVKTKFSIHNILKDSTIKSDSNALVHLIYNKSLYQLNVDSFFAFSDTTIAKSFTIDSLQLYNLNVQYPLSLGEIAKQSGSIGTLIIALNKSYFPIPAIGPLTVPKISINIDSIFTSMTLDDGKVEVSFENNLPIDITDLKFDLRNVTDNNLIAQGNFPIIKTNTKESQTYSLAGQTIGSKISVEVTNFSTPGSNNIPVLIDTSNSIIANLRVFDLRPNKATALWPAQNLIEQHLDFDLNGLSVQLKFAKIKSGKIYLKLRSTIDDTLRFNYDLPGATLNGNPFIIRKNLQPGTTAHPSEIYEEYDFSGYDFDLSGSKKDTFNATPNSIIISIDSTGVQKTFSKADNIFVELGFKDLKPSYARGYLGSELFSFGPSTVDLDFFKDINGIVNFEDIKMDVNIENNIGADAVFNIANITSINSKNSQKLKLSSNLLDQPINVLKAKDNNGSLPIISSNTSFQLNKNNSNINAAVNLLPDQLSYELSFQPNPLGNNRQYNDFIYDGKLMNIELGLDVPLYLSANGLCLEKTLTFDPSTLDLDKVLDGNLYLNVDNEFPISANLSMRFLDDNIIPIQDNYKIDGLIEAATINAQGKVTEKKNTILKIPLSNKQIVLLKKSKKLIIKSIFNTQPNQQSIKIFEQYGMDITLSADFNYRIN